ncbi:superoxide dismutase [Candidatus Falkowbacteria bacterium]|nr:superoxide dismutase [Candidatus Falkowbacteria bacterium]
MAYAAKNFDNLLGIPGISDQLLTNHFTLYQGYVTNTNKVLEELKSLLAAGQQSSPQAAELRRRMGWEWNGMRLHELYFANLTNKPAPYDFNSALIQKITADFISMENFEAELRSVASMRGIGWAVLYHDPAADQLLISWVNEHDQAHLAGAKPLLVIDVFEHAFMIDYGLKRADYIDAVMKVIDWEAVAARL